MNGQRVAATSLARSSSPPVEGGPYWRGTRQVQRKHAIALCLTVLVAAAVYSLYSIVTHLHFGTTIYDAVIFDQAVRGYASFDLPVSAALGEHDGYGFGFSVLGDHFSPILALLAPLYWIHDGPIVLYVAQAVLFALAIPVLWVFTRRALGTVAAYLVAFAYALSWQVQHAVSFDFHEVAFAPVIMALMFERVQAGRHRHVMLAAAVLLLVKEDMGLAVTGFGLCLLLLRSWRAGTALTIGGVTATWLITRFIIPLFGGTSNARWHYDALGQDVPSAAMHVLTNPLEVLQLATTPGVKLHTLLWIFAPVLFIALLSPMVLPAIPLLAERLLAADMPTWWEVGFQYDAFIVVPVLCAAVDAARRVRDWARRRVPVRGSGTAWAGVVCAISLLLLPRLPFADLWHPEWYRGGDRVAAQRAAVARVPAGVWVEASNHIGPQLTARSNVLLFDSDPAGAPWVVADLREWRFPFASLEAQRGQVQELVAGDYEVVFEREGVVVLHRAGA